VGLGNEVSSADGPPGCGATDTVNATLANAVRKSVAQIDGGGASEVILFGGGGAGQRA
jgi:hypothetical protein